MGSRKHRPLSDKVRAEVKHGLEMHAREWVLRFISALPRKEWSGRMRVWNWRVTGRRDAVSAVIDRVWSELCSAKKPMLSVTEASRRLPDQAKRQLRRDLLLMAGNEAQELLAHAVFVVARRRPHSPFLENDVWETLQDWFGGWIHGYLRRRLPAEERHSGTVEMLAAETFEKALTNISAYARAKGKFGAWIWGIARNTLWNYIRDRRRQPGTIEEGLEPDAGLEGPTQDELMQYRRHVLSGVSTIAKEVMTKDDWLTQRYEQVDKAAQLVGQPANVIWFQVIVLHLLGVTVRRYSAMTNITSIRCLAAITQQAADDLMYCLENDHELGSMIAEETIAAIVDAGLGACFDAPVGANADPPTGVGNSEVMQILAALAQIARQGPHVFESAALWSLGVSEGQATQLCSQCDPFSYVKSCMGPIVQDDVTEYIGKNGLLAVVQ
jgi:DNA-directed RNA polymerase specialized sigma24 family protein